jgi:RNA 2',3'-cyclic 3'-phosphodiesterase
LRLFIALVPPPELRRQLGELAEMAHARCRGRRMPNESLHLTLAFLGEVNEERAAALSEWLPSFRVVPDRWQLDRWGHFRRPQILWAGSQAPQPELEALHHALWHDLALHGFKAERRRFLPHVTLMRRVTAPHFTRLPDFRLEWPYAQVELIQSVIDERGARYVSLARSATE